MGLGAGSTPARDTAVGIVLRGLVEVSNTEREGVEKSFAAMTTRGSEWLSLNGKRTGREYEEGRTRIRERDERQSREDAGEGKQWHWK